MGSRRTSVILVVAAAVALSACTSSSAPPDRHSPPGTTAAPSTAPPSTAPATGLLAPTAVRDVLVAASVRLSSDDGQQTVAGPDDAAITVPESAVAGLAAQAAQHSGSLGTRLDELGGGAPTALPLSVVVAAYARSVQTPGAQTARAALAGETLTDPKGTVFPALVLLLFAADAVHEMGAGPTAVHSVRQRGAPGGPAEARLVSFQPCSKFREVVFGTINEVFDRLHIPPVKIGNTGSRFLNAILQGLTDIVVGGLNIIIEGTRAIIINTVELLFADLIDLIAKVSSIAALVGSVIANFREVSLLISPEPTEITRGTAPVQGKVTLSARVEGPTDWPEGLNDCAKEATGEDLPDLTAVGSPVSWKLYAFPQDIDLAHPVAEGTDHALKDMGKGQDAEAKYYFETGVESGKEDQEQPGLAKVTGSMRRKGLAEIAKALVKLAEGALGSLTKKLPEPFKGFIDGLLRDAATSIAEKLAAQLDVTRHAQVTVIYHEGKKPSTSPPPPAGGGPVSVAFDAVFHTPFGYDTAIAFAAKSCGGPSGPWMATVHATHGPPTPKDPSFNRSWRIRYAFDAKGHARIDIPVHPDVIAGTTHSEMIWAIAELSEDKTSMTIVDFRGIEDGSPPYNLTDRLTVTGQPLAFTPAVC